MDRPFGDTMKAERKALTVAELRKRAADGETITYGELAKQVGLAPQGPWKAMLDEIGAEERAEGRPDLVCLAVSARSGVRGYVSSEKEGAATLAERQRVFDAHRKP